MPIHILGHTGTPQWLLTLPKPEQDKELAALIDEVANDTFMLPPAENGYDAAPTELKEKARSLRQERYLSECEDFSLPIKTRYVSVAAPPPTPLTPGPRNAMDVKTRRACINHCEPHRSGWAECKNPPGGINRPCIHEQAEAIAKTKMLVSTTIDYYNAARLGLTGPSAK